MSRCSVTRSDHDAHARSTPTSVHVLTAACVCVSALPCSQCLALSFLSIDSTRANAQISALLAAGVMPHLIRLLQHQDTRILTQAMRTVGNMLGGNALQTSAVINAGFLPVLRPLLSHARREVRNEALWALSSG